MAHSSDRSSLRVSAEMGPKAALAAAGIWAEATATRDGLSPAPSAEEKLPGIHQALAHHGAALLIAQLDDDVAGFALLVPRAHAMELLYLAVDPAAWGRGVAGTLLRHTELHAAHERTPLELWVIADNERALRTYERAGWTATDEVTVRNSSGRRERKYVHG